MDIHFHFSWINIWGEVAGSYDQHMFNFLTHFHTLFQGHRIILCSYQQCVGVPIMLHHHQNLILLIFLIWAILVGVQWYPLVALFAFSWKLVTWRILYAYWPLIYLLLWNSSFFWPIFNWVVFLLLKHKCSLFFSRNKPSHLLDVCFTNLLSESGLSFHFNCVFQRVKCFKFWCLLISVSSGLFKISLSKPGSQLIFLCFLLQV